MDGEELGELLSAQTIGEKLLELLLLLLQLKQRVGWLAKGHETRKSVDMTPLGERKELISGLVLSRGTNYKRSASGGRADWLDSSSGLTPKNFRQVFGFSIAERETNREPGSVEQVRTLAGRIHRPPGDSCSRSRGDEIETG